jgi:hypothetical protein
MKSFLIVFAIITLAVVIAACEQKPVETKPDAAADASAPAADAAVPAADSAVAPVQPLAEAPLADTTPAAGPAEVGPAVVLLPTAEAAPAAEPAK